MDIEEFASDLSNASNVFLNGIFNAAFTFRIPKTQIYLQLIRVLSFPSCFAEYAITDLPNSLQILASDDLVALKSYFAESQPSINALISSNCAKQPLSLIYYAALFGSNACFNYLLMNQAKRCFNDEEMNLFEVALLGGDEFIIQLLLENNHSLCWSPKSVIDGFHPHILKWIINECDADVSELLHRACYWSNYRAVIITLDKGANINHYDQQDDRSITSELAAFGDDVLAQFLCDKGLSINRNDDLTPLMNAISYDKVNVAEVFLKNGANMNSTNSNGQNALHFAQSLDAVKLLMKYHIDINRRDNDEMVPLERIVGRDCGINVLLYLNHHMVFHQWMFPHILETANDQCLEFLLQIKFDPQYNNNSAIIHALQEDRISAASLLLKYGATIPKADAFPYNQLSNTASMFLRNYIAENWPLSDLISLVHKDHEKERSPEKFYTKYSRWLF